MPVVRDLVLNDRPPVNACLAGFYDTQYSDRQQPDCRGRVRSDAEGRYGYRAVVPVAYPIPGDVRLASKPCVRFMTNALRALLANSS